MVWLRNLFKSVKAIQKLDFADYVKNLSFHNTT